MSTKSIAFSRGHMYKAIVEYTQEMIEFGDIQGLNRLGFDGKTIESLAGLSIKDIQRYGPKCEATNDLFAITADERQINLFISAIQKQREIDESADQLIRLGGPQSMLASLAGLSDHEFRRRKNKIKLTYSDFDESLIRQTPSKRNKAEAEKMLMTMRDKKAQLTIRDFLGISEKSEVPVRDIWSSFQDYEKLKDVKKLK